MDVVKKVLEWLEEKKFVNYVNARRIARRFGIDSRRASYVLRHLAELGYVHLYKPRRGRFNIYKVNRRRLNNKRVIVD